MRALGNRLEFRIPPNTFAQAVTFVLADVLGLSGLPGLLLASAFDFRIEGQAPAKDMDLSVKFDPANLPDGVRAEDLRLYLLRPEGPLEIPGSTVDVANGTVTAPVREQGRYAVAAPAP